MILPNKLQLDLILRYNDVIESALVPAYTEMDARLGWQVSDNCEVEIVGRNLLNSSHFEDGITAELQNQTSAVQRGLYGMIRLVY